MALTDGRNQWHVSIATPNQFMLTV